MRPDWESNHWPFALQDDVQPTNLHWSVQRQLHLYSVSVVILTLMLTAWSVHTGKNSNLKCVLWWTFTSRHTHPRHPDQDKHISSFPETPLRSLSNYYHIYKNNHYINFYHHRLVLPIFELNMNDVIHFVLLGTWLFFLLLCLWDLSLLCVISSLPFVV